MLAQRCSLLFLFLPFLANALETQDCVRKFPSIQKTLEIITPFREAAKGSSRLSFSDLVAMAKDAERTVNSQQADIQKIGCGENADKDLGACILPVSWSCEGIPLSIDLSFLSSVKKTKDEELALVTGQLLKSTDLFQICCGDFGCHPSGIGIPYLFHEKSKIEALANLAVVGGQFGNIAFNSLKLSVSGLETANCSCEPPTAVEDLKQVVENFAVVKSGIRSKSERAKSVSELYARIIAGLKKGVPKVKCRLPGY